MIALAGRRKKFPIFSILYEKPDKLVVWIAEQGTRAKLRPSDMKLVLIREWDKAQDRLRGTRQMMQALVKLAA
jgi:transcription-repair coupling factor (superfamily II helicase)